jgi:hypothetical protein
MRIHIYILVVGLQGMVKDVDAQCTTLTNQFRDHGLVLRQHLDHTHARTLAYKEVYIYIYIYCFIRSNRMSIFKYLFFYPIMARPYIYIYVSTWWSFHSLVANVLK